MLEFEKLEAWLAVVERCAAIGGKNYLEIKLLIAIRHDGLVVQFVDSIGQVVGSSHVLAGVFFPFFYPFTLISFHFR